MGDVTSSQESESERHHDNKSIVNKRVAMAGTGFLDGAPYDEGLADISIYGHLKAQN